MKKYLVVACILALSACARRGGVDTTVPTGRAKLPTSWYLLPEDRPAGVSEKALGLEVEQEQSDQASLSDSLDRLYDVNTQSISNVALDTVPQGTSDPTKPKDWVPWHMEMFTTDIGVTASGLVGALTLNGNPAVQAFWRRLPDRSYADQQAGEDSAAADRFGADVPTVRLTGRTSAQEIRAQVEPMVQVAVASGKVDDENSLRENLVQAATEFQEYVLALDSVNAESPDSQWWISGFRFDFTISATSHPIAIGTVGGDTRLRFEWKRLQRSQPVATGPKRIARVSPRVAQVSAGLKTFVKDFRQDLATAADVAYENTGFEAVSFRIGVGATASGSIGIAKASGSILGHINFSRDLSKPKATAHPEAERPVYLIEGQEDSHLRYADVNGVPHESYLDKIVYQVDREEFRKGLERAIHIGNFFASRGTPNSGGSWAVFQIKANYDMSITGDLGLVGMGGLASAEVVFQNLSF